MKLRTGLLVLLGLALQGVAAAATVSIINADDPGEGFNASAARAPEGGNAGTTLGAQRLNVFRRAAEIWGLRLSSSQVIKIEASFDPLECSPAGAVLGSAGPADFFVHTFPGSQSRFVPVALREALVGSNLNGSDPEIFAQYNSAIDSGCLDANTRWWYGIDPNVAVPAGRIPLLQTVLHEIGHGLGFLSLVCLQSSCDQPGFSWPQGGYPNGTFDRWADFQRDRATGQLWTALSNPQRFSSARSVNQLVWDGSNVNAEFAQVPVATAGQNAGRVKLYAPNPIEGGSSVSHWTRDSNAPDLLMEPVIGSTGRIDQVDLTTALLKDIGWTVSAGSGPTSTQITSDSPDPSASGVPYTVAVTVTSPQGGITGTVAITDGSASCTTPALVSGSGSCTLTSSGNGNKTLVASYSGNASRGGSSDVEAHQVGSGGGGLTPTITLVSDSPDTTVSGQPYTASFSVSSGSGTPAGTVTVNDGSGANCSAALNGSGTGSCQLVSSVPGTRTLTASYSGSASHAASSGTTTHQVNKAATTLAIVSDTPDPSVVGQAVTVGFSLAVTAPGSGTPTGTVTITAAGGSESCSATLPDTSCSLVLLGAGTRSLSASYGGDAGFNGTTSAAVMHTVNKASVALAIVSDTPDPSVSGQVVTVGFSIAALAPGGGTPAGTVTISAAGGGESCSATLPTSSCSLLLLDTGVRSLVASYAGNASYNAATSTTALHTVNAAATTLAIVSHSPDPSVAGQLVTVGFALDVSAPGSGSPTGTVVISASGGSESCSAVLPASSCALVLSAIGPRTLRATYAGDGRFSASASANVAHAVGFAPTTTTITADSPDPSVFGQPYTVAVSLASPVGVPPGALVQVGDGSGASCQASIGSDGNGSCQLLSGPPGLRTLDASFGQSGTFSGSSASEPHAIQRAASALQIASLAPSPSAAGEAVTVTVQLAAVAPGAGTPGGSVLVSASPTETCSIVLPQTSCALTLLTPGNRSIGASYAGDGNFSGSSATRLQVVTLLPGDAVLVDGFEGTQ